LQWFNIPKCDHSADMTEGDLGFSKFEARIWFTSPAHLAFWSGNALRSGFGARLKGLVCLGPGLRVEAGGDGEEARKRGFLLSGRSAGGGGVFGAGGDDEKAGGGGTDQKEEDKSEIE
jgi:hypothetical protein